MYAYKNFSLYEIYEYVFHIRFSVIKARVKSDGKPVGQAMVYRIKQLKYFKEKVHRQTIDNTGLRRTLNVSNNY